MTDMTQSTEHWYRRHAARYARDTLTVDMAPLRARFLAHLPATGAHLLDAGCGAGRDARAFRDLGHVVTAFDASPELATLASAHLGRPVAVLRFQDLDDTEDFDGIWACASLLHVPATELPGVIARLRRALRTGGVLYASFKYGRGERVDAGRRFTDLDETGLQGLFGSVAGWQLLEHWISQDQRPGRRQQAWLNMIAAK